MINGYNPMRWDCAKDGCFNKKRRPKIEVFYDCFPGKINFGDVDGEVEINGFFCQLEWKGKGGNLHTGQRIKFENYTKTDGNIVFVVDGDAETMEVQSFFYFWCGQRKTTQQAGIQTLKKFIKSWAKQAKARHFLGSAI